MIILLVAGGFGGVVRGLMGFVKHRLSYKDVPFKPDYFLGTVGLSALVGVTVTWALVGSGLKLPLVDQINPALAFIVGYAGGDFLENLYKLLIKETTIFPKSS